ncbi:MAG: gamma-glutamylcyclotransferase [Oscillatoriales cyanobacterium RM2_1_1]|nr:gamma-glutamylcyclotransferase [Oscillatoriales cyanobacterium SM2_3_0]NJO46275.1 gamma-glutamylcyclotransferase [Oscillatoriales cyanobacterium RM2_1_1]
MRVFVYGTLKPGEINYQQYCSLYPIHTQPAIAQGRLFQLSLGYPAMIPGDGRVQGVILSFEDPQLLSTLDDLEDYHPHRLPEENEYQRQQILVCTPSEQPLGNVWAYFMTLEKIQLLGGVEIPEGNWGTQGNCSKF